MRNWLLHIHLYGGLLCSSYIIIFAINSLQINHDFWVSDLPEEPTEVWERSISLPAAEDDRALAEAVRDELGLFGFAHAWTFRRDSANVLHYTMSRTGREYRLQVAPDGHATVEARHLPLGNVIRGLHATMRLPGSRFMSGWGIYTEMCTLVVLFSAASGVYLWTARRSERAIGLALLVGASGGALAFMFYVWLRG